MGTDGKIKEGAFDFNADVSAKRVFENNTLCAQFLRNYGKLPLFEDICAEDIEDVSERYHIFDEVEFNSDTVKKIRIKNNELPVYVISLIEHKSNVDYNVTMQILKYMVCIWENWEKELEALDVKEGRKPYKHCMRKDFKYPPVYPIVYYEGADEWTAPMYLSDRIFMSSIFEAYIPNITYKLVGVRNYSNDELISNEDAMSLIMMLTKIQKAKDFDEFKSIPKDSLNRIIENSSEDVVSMVMSMVWSLCRRLNVSEEEATEYVRRIGEKDMGYFWENMEKMDIQEERRKTAEQTERADKAEERADKAEERADKAEAKLKETEERADKAEAQIMTSLISTYQDFNLTKKDAVKLLSEKLEISEEEAEKEIEKYWK